MAAYEQKDNSGSIFKNTRREKDTHPNMTGKAMIDGKMYYVSAWTKDGKGGERYQSLSFKPVDDSAKADRGASDDRPLDIQLDDNIPF